jgi:hypothetical protein
LRSLPLGRACGSVGVSWQRFDLWRATRALATASLATMARSIFHASHLLHQDGAKCSKGEALPPQNRRAFARGRGEGVDGILAWFGERQYGVVARRQLLAAGVGRRAIGARLGRSSLHPLYRGVYAIGHLAISSEARWMAAVLASGPDAVLSHRSAAGLWGMLPRPRGRTEVTRPRSFRGQSGIKASRASLPPDEVSEVAGIPVTSVSRTLVDLAAVVSRCELEKALNEAEILRLTDRLSLPELLRRYPRRKGSAALRALLHDADAGKGVTRSELEERFAALIDAYGLPRPQRNADLAVRGRFFKADCLWRRQGIIVELDGRAVHGTVQAFEADRERDRLLVGEGWRVIHLTWLQVRDNAPEIAADLRRALAQDLL